MLSSASHVLCISEAQWKDPGSKGTGKCFTYQIFQVCYGNLAFNTARSSDIIFIELKKKKEPLTYLSIMLFHERHLGCRCYGLVRVTMCRLKCSMVPHSFSCSTHLELKTNKFKSNYFFYFNSIKYPTGTLQLQLQGKYRANQSRLSYEKVFNLHQKSASGQWPLDDSLLHSNKRLIHVEQIVRGQSNNHSCKNTKELTSCKNIIRWNKLDKWCLKKCPFM